MDNMILWSPGVTLEEIEKQVILKAFRFYRGNKTTTANALGIAIRTLDNKLEKYENDGAAQKERDNEIRERELAFGIRQRGFQQGPNESAEDREASRRSVLPSSDARLSMEPAPHVSAQQPVPVSKPHEVQKVLSTKDAQSSAGRRR